MVLSVVNPPSDHAAVAAFIDRNGVVTPILFDCGQVAASYMKLTPQNPQIALPHFFVVDQRGTIRSDYEYAATTETYFTGDAAPLVEEIEALLREGSDPAAKRPASKQ